LIVVGVHTPEFPFERYVENVREAASALRVEYPIALDSDYQAGALPFGCKVEVQTIASHS